jgi:hypothetical protein
VKGLTYLACLLKSRRHEGAENKITASKVKDWQPLKCI